MAQFCIIRSPASPLGICIVLVSHLCSPRETLLLPSTSSRWWGPPSLTILSPLPLDTPHALFRQGPREGNTAPSWSEQKDCSFPSSDMRLLQLYDTSGSCGPWSQLKLQAFLFHMVCWPWWVTHLPLCTTQDSDQDFFSLFICFKPKWIPVKFYLPVVILYPAF